MGLQLPLERREAKRVLFIYTFLALASATETVTLTWTAIRRIGYGD